MALINCPDCKKEISDAAEVCIGCGYPLSKSVKPIQVPSELPVAERNKVNDQNLKKKWYAIFLWWQTDAKVITEQVQSYTTLAWYKSYRKSAAALMIAFSVFTVLLGLILDNTSVFVDAVLMFFLATFIFKGHKWAIYSGMIYWTAAKAYAIYESPRGLITQIIFWCLLMSLLYTSLQIEKSRSKLDSSS